MLVSGNNTNLAYQNTVKTYKGTPMNLSTDISDYYLKTAKCALFTTVLYISLLKFKF